MSTPVFRDYDQEALDREYNNMAKVPGAAEIMARSEAASAEARAALTCRLDVPYGASEAEKLDLFLPDGPGPHPVMVYIHGGYWRARNRRDFSFVAPPFVARGVATAVSGYALCPVVSIDELVRQCRAAVAWLWKNADSLSLDRDRLFVCGHSAGGHIVAMCLATPWREFDSALPADPIRGATALSGLYDLEPIRLCFLNAEVRMSAQDAARNSPVLLTPGSTPPLILAVGGLEGPEYLRQTRDLEAAWTPHGIAPRVMVLDGADHFSILDELTDPARPLARAVFAQIGV